MTHSIEFIIQTESYQHVKITVTRDTKDEAISELIEYSDQDLHGLGFAWLAAKSQVMAGRAEALGEAQPTPDKLIQDELGGKVLEVTEHRPAPAWAVPVESETKPWQQPKAATEKPGDDW